MVSAHALNILLQFDTDFFTLYHVSVWFSFSAETISHISFVDLYMSCNIILSNIVSIWSFSRFIWNWFSTLVILYDSFVYKCLR